LNTGVTCDAIGCIGKLADGRLASMVLDVEAFAEDCAHAAVVVSARQAPLLVCAATLIDRRRLAHASRRCLALERPAFRAKRHTATGLCAAVDARHRRRYVRRPAYHQRTRSA
jgi:competence protein ComEC